MVLLRSGQKTEKAPTKQYLSALDAYKKENRGEFKQKFANAGEAQRVLREKFESLSDKQQEKYQKMFEEAEEQYQKKLVLFYGGSNKDIKNLQDVEKIPPRPIQPMNAMFRYFDDHRENVYKQNPGIQLGDVTKILTERWTNLDAKHKKPYNDDYKKAQNKFHAELEEWKKNYEKKFKEGQRLIVEKHKFQNHDKPGLNYEEILSAKQKRRELVSLSPKRQKGEKNEKRGGRPKQQKDQKDQKDQRSETEHYPRQDRSSSQRDNSQKKEAPKKGK